MSAIIIKDTQLTTDLVEIVLEIVNRSQELLERADGSTNSIEETQEFKNVLGKFIWMNWQILENLMSNSPIEHSHINQQIASQQIEEWSNHLGPEIINAYGMWANPSKDQKYIISSDKQFAEHTLSIFEKISELIGELDDRLRNSGEAEKSKMEALSEISLIASGFVGVQCVLFIDHPELIKEPYWHEIVSDFRKMG